MAEKRELTGFGSTNPPYSYGEQQRNRSRIKQTDFSQFELPKYSQFSPSLPPPPNYSQFSQSELPNYSQFSPSLPPPPNYSQFELPNYSQFSPSLLHQPPDYSDFSQFDAASPNYSFAAQLRDQEQREAEREALQRQLRKLGKSIVKQTDFSLSLAKHVISTTADGSNFVFSPLSMHIVLSMVAAGSSGPTRAQFLDFLKSKSVEELNSLSSQVAALLLADGGGLGGPRLSFADGVWVDQSLTLKPAFLEVVEKDYKAASLPADFQNKANEVREEVNWWAEKETNGLIKDLLPPGSVDSTTRLILANALYFKGAWDEKFDASLTKDNDFFLNGTNYVRVPFMSSRKRQYVRAFRGFKVLRLPYGQGDDMRKFSMLIYLPDARDGLPALLDMFGSVPEFIQNHFPYCWVPVRQFRIPKFKINFGFEATKVLQGHGLVLPFSPGGLTEMVENGGKDLYISSFFHKACIEVDEKGTEASAASACVLNCQQSLRPPPKEEEVDFVADHPFLFVVREDVSGGVLFVGQVVDPNAG